MRKLRIAVAGAGLIGLRHIEETQRSRSAQLSAIVDPSPRAAEIAKKEGVPIYSSLDELIAKDRPDGIVLATPNQMHVAQGLQCIAVDIPVLVEKPIAHTLEEGKRLVETAERANAKLLVGHHRPHSPILHKAVEVIKSGILGPIVAVMGSAVFYKPDTYYGEAPGRSEAVGQRPRRPPESARDGRHRRSGEDGKDGHRRYEVAHRCRWPLSTEPAGKQRQLMAGPGNSMGQGAFGGAITFRWSGYEKVSDASWHQPQHVREKRPGAVRNDHACRDRREAAGACKGARRRSSELPDEQRRRDV